MTPPGTPATPSKGEIWLVNLDPTVGDEMRKSRPAVVMNRDALGVLALRVVVPLTHWQDRFQQWSWLVRIDPDATNGLDRVSAADAFQVRSLSLRRLTHRIGHLGARDVARIAKALRDVLEV